MSIWSEISDTITEAHNKLIKNIRKYFESNFDIVDIQELQHCVVINLKYTMSIVIDYDYNDYNDYNKCLLYQIAFYTELDDEDSYHGYDFNDLEDGINNIMKQFVLTYKEFFNSHNENQLNDHQHELYKIYKKFENIV